MDLGKSEERIINAFVTWNWRRMLKIKWTDKKRMMKFFKGRKKKDYFLKLKK